MTSTKAMPFTPVNRTKTIPTRGNDNRPYEERPRPRCDRVLPYCLSEGCPNKMQTAARFQGFCRRHARNNGFTHPEDKEAEEKKPMTPTPDPDDKEAEEKKPMTPQAPDKETRATMSDPAAFPQQPLRKAGEHLDAIETASKGTDKLAEDADGPRSDLTAPQDDAEASEPQAAMPSSAGPAASGTSAESSTSSSSSTSTSASSGNATPQSRTRASPLEGSRQVRQRTDTGSTHVSKLCLNDETRLRDLRDSAPLTRHENPFRTPSQRSTATKIGRRRH